MKFNNLKNAAWSSFFLLSCFILLLIITMCFLIPNTGNGVYKLFEYIGRNGFDIFNDSATYYNGSRWVKFGDEIRMICFTIFGLWVILTLIINQNLNRKDKEREKEIEEQEFRKRMEEFMDNE